MLTARSRYLLPLFVLMAAAISAVGQDNSFSDELADYTFLLPDEKWKMTVKPSATDASVEYVFGDRRNGHLEVRKHSIARDGLLTDMVRDEEQKLMFRLGFVAGKEENFAGKLKGTIYNFEYVASGRTMAGRFYFVRSGDTAVYVLRFTGLKDSMRSLRSQTDSIARTFSVK
ncbi:MAG: hypothetical protein KBD94_05860 [Pyrinomonadaceae bacterium]|nr:hypothetical protein [Pyrinomonadaceae bacterium]